MGAVDPKKLFALKKPCSNCPFLKTGAIELQPGRVAGIVEHLLADDWNDFSCHKTTGDSWDEEADGTFQRSGKESMCYGAMTYLLKKKQANVPMRLAFSMGLLDHDAMQNQFDKIIEEP